MPALLPPASVLHRCLQQGGFFEQGRKGADICPCCAVRPCAGRLVNAHQAETGQYLGMHATKGSAPSKTSAVCAPGLMVSGVPSPCPLYPRYRSLSSLSEASSARSLSYSARSLACSSAYAIACCMCAAVWPAFTAASSALASASLASATACRARAAAVKGAALGGPVLPVPPAFPTPGAGGCWPLNRESTSSTQDSPIRDAPASSAHSPSSPAAAMAPSIQPACVRTVLRLPLRDPRSLCQPPLQPLPLLHWMRPLDLALPMLALQLFCSFPRPVPPLWSPVWPLLLLPLARGGAGSPPHHSRFARLGAEGCLLDGRVGSAQFRGLPMSFGLSGVAKRADSAAEGPL